ncbi:hypothetical protein ASG68_24290 [Rhizobium sp. Leaf453]|nr:hypothetical protein ASG68_24290 [Rhizobium sp. Leaf453]
MKLLNECVKRGSKIGTIAGLSDSSLRKVLQEHGHRTAPLAEVLDCVRRLDQAGLEAQLGIRLVAMGSNAFAQEFVLPLLQEVGDLWAQGLLSTAAEHMLSASLRSLLGAAVRIGNPYTPRATALFATPEGDLHEFGLLSAAIAAQAQGIRTIYLGPQVPTEELAKAAKSTGARFIVLSSEVLEPQRLQNAHCAYTIRIIGLLLAGVVLVRSTARKLNEQSSSYQLPILKAGWHSQGSTEFISIFRPGFRHRRRVDACGLAGRMTISYECQPCYAGFTPRLAILCLTLEGSSVTYVARSSILIVEDQSLIAMDLEHMLVELGFRGMVSKPTSPAAECCALKKCG